MRRSLAFSLLAFSMLALFSCTQEETVTSFQKTRGLVISATREGDSPDTKTEIVGDKTYWSVGDKISVFFGSGTSGGAEFTSTNTEPSYSADFTGILNTVTGSEAGSGTKYFWGVYPYSSLNSLSLDGDSNLLTTTVNDHQYGVANSYSPGQNISIGRSLGLEISFKSLLSGIKLTFSRSDITRVVIKGNNGEYLAGTVKVSMDSGVPVVSSVTSPKTSITLLPEEGRETFLSGGVIYRALFLPTNFTNGLTVTFYTSDGSVGVRNFGTLNFERNLPKSASNADQPATFTSPEPVDMGNGLLMAPWNVGATNSLEAGYYFCWGETNPDKTAYSWATYEWGSNANSMTKYVIDPSYGTPDYHMYLLEEDDAATKHWGPSWRTPTDAEWNILLDESKYTWTYYTNYRSSGVSGWTVTSNSTNGRIFLPAAGDYNSLGVQRVNTEGYYLSSVLGTGNSNPNVLYFTASSHTVTNNVTNASRRVGKSVRPIYASRVPVESIVPSAEHYHIVDNGQPKSVYVYRITPEDAFDRGLHVYTTDPTIAAVAASQHNFVNVSAVGVSIPLTINGPGETELIIETPDHSVRFTMELEIESAVTGITLDKTSYTFSNYLDKMTPLKLNATVSPSTANQDVYWRSSDESVATVDYYTGVVTPVGQGTATISASKGSYQATCQITVDPWVHATSIGSSGVGIRSTYKANYETPVGLYVMPNDAHDKTILWSTSDEEVAKVYWDSVNGYYTLKTYKPGICEITATTQDGGITDSWIATVVSDFVGSHAYVDLGNGYKIASTNVGAENPWDHGDRFFWGGTVIQTRSSFTTLGKLDWHSYPYFAGFVTLPNLGPIMTKYVCTLQKDPALIDNLSILQPKDDAATKHWGSSWITPRYEEWESIIYLCTTTEATVAGVPGVMLKSKMNGAKVFIPYWQTLTLGLDPTISERTRLWTGTVSEDEPEFAKNVLLENGEITFEENERNHTYYVRPIYKE